MVIRPFNKLATALMILAMIFSARAQICQCLIDSVWFSEETNCDNENLVNICYHYTNTCGDEASATINVEISSDAGVTWYEPGEGWFNTIWGPGGTWGDGVMPGTHCFTWAMDRDLPGVESFDFRIRVSSSCGCCTGMPNLRDNGTMSSILICGPFSGTDPSAPELDPTMDYQAGMTMSGRTWFIDTTSIDTTAWGSDLPGWIWFNERYGWEGPGHCYIHFYLCTDTTEDVTIYFWTRHDDDIVMWIDGEEVFSDLDHHDNVQSEFSPNVVPLTLDCSWHSVYIWLCDYRINYSFSHQFQDAAGNPITWLHYTLDPPSDDYHFADTLIAAGPLDSHHPEVSIICPDSSETLFPGDTIEFPWTIEDLFWDNDPGSLIIDYCAGETVIIFPPTSPIEWVIPDAAEGCPNVEVTIGVRDSFCNWGYDSCSFSLLECVPGIASLICAPCGGYSSCNSQSVTFNVVDTTMVDIDTTGYLPHWWLLIWMEHLKRCTLPRVRHT